MMFIQKEDLKFYFLGWDEQSGKWYRYNAGYPLGSGRRNTPLAAVRAEGENPATIHLFYIDTDNRIKEYLLPYQSGWSPGATLPADDIADSSDLAAVATGEGSGLELRVFYQKTDATVEELRFYNGSWHKARQFTDAKAGTGLTVLNSDAYKGLDATPFLHLFYVGQVKYDKLIHQSAKGGDDWTREQLLEQGGGGLTSVSWSTYNDHEMMLHFPNGDLPGEVVGMLYTSNTGWDGARLPDYTVKSHNRPLASVAFFPTQGLTIGVFVKSAEAQIEEMYYEKGDWKGTRTINVF
jgi:hypothetical protein